MEFHSEPNLLLEALAYLGRRAAGYDTAWMLSRLARRGVVDTSALTSRTAPIARLTQALDLALPLDTDRLTFLFGNLPGFPYNTIGSYSRGFLLLYPLVSRFRGCCDEAAALVRGRSRAVQAGDLAMMLDLGEEPELSGEVFSDRVLSLNIPAESKVAVLELFHRGKDVFEEALALVRRVVAALEAHPALLEACCAPFNQEILETGTEAVIASTSSLDPGGGRSDIVRPFVFGMDTLLAVTPADGGPVQVYCGILRSPLQAMLASAKEPRTEVWEAIRLLADQTRFDILCYLRSHDAYGQELAAKFGLSRNTIHHHMTKLLAAHLVKCTVDGNRVYYRADAETISRLLARQRELLLP